MRYYSFDNRCGDYYVPNIGDTGTVWEVIGRSVKFVRYEPFEKILELRRKQTLRFQRKKKLRQLVMMAQRFDSHIWEIDYIG